MGEICKTIKKKKNLKKKLSNGVGTTHITCQPGLGTVLHEQHDMNTKETKRRNTQLYMFYFIKPKH